MRMTILELSDDSDDDDLVGTKQREQTCVTTRTDGFLSSAVCWEPLICESPELSLSSSSSP